MSFTKKYGVLLLILLVFSIAFGLISLPNHWNFRSYTLDLGMFNHAIFDFSEFRNNVFSTGVQGKDLNYFYDHFSPITVLFSPFRFLGTSGLLIAQILMVLFGGYGAFRFAQIKSSSKVLPYLALIYFFVHWGVANALAYDFHTNVIAAMFVPWLFVFFYEKKWKSFIIIFVLTIICKENISLWLVFILTGLLLQSWKTSSNKTKFLLSGLIIFSGIYFIVITGIVMPSLGDRSKQMARYAHLGSSIPEIIGNLISNPLESIGYLYKNVSETANYDFAKIEFHWMTLFAGGVLLIFKPSYLIMVIPLYAQKFLSTQLGLWGIGGHYSIEFVPIMTLGLIDVLKNLNRYKLNVLVFSVIIISTAMSNHRKMEERSDQWYLTKRINLFKSAHYNTHYDKARIYKKLESIDENSIVSASNVLVPHLAFRDQIYLYPRVDDADMIILIRPTWDENNSYPIRIEDFNASVEKNLTAGWNILYDDGQLIILEK